MCVCVCWVAGVFLQLWWITLSSSAPPGRWRRRNRETTRRFLLSALSSRHGVKMSELCIILHRCTCGPAVMLLLRSLLHSKDPQEPNSMRDMTYSSVLAQTRKLRTFSAIRNSWETFQLAIVDLKWRQIQQLVVMQVPKSLWRGERKTGDDVRQVPPNLCDFQMPVMTQCPVSLLI